ncbi:MAG: hypothetical protein IKN87_03465 [Bacilli bacterium]|nr:hypothetical protein [Bacilli bacterium]
MRQIPKKNYFYLLLLVAITVILTLVFFNIYRNYSNNKKSYMSQNLTNINSLDLNSLLIENSLLFVYVDDKYDNKDNELEEKLFKELKDNDVNKSFVFYDNTNVKNQKYILNKYKIDIKGKKMLLVFEENQLVLKHILKDDVEDEIISIVSKFEDIDD